MPKTSETAFQEIGTLGEQRTKNTDSQVSKEGDPSAQPS